MILEFFSNLNNSMKGRNCLGNRGGILPFDRCPSLQTFGLLRSCTSEENPSGTLCRSVTFPRSSPAQLLAMFRNLLERPVLAAVAAGKVPVLLSMFSTALDHARLTYTRHTQAGLQLGGCPVRRKTDFTGNWI